jgi:hypothetical protein
MMMITRLEDSNGEDRDKDNNSYSIVIVMMMMQIIMITLMCNIFTITSKTYSD